MEIYLDHPHNGAMVVYSEAEAAPWLTKGWAKRVGEHPEIARKKALLGPQPVPVPQTAPNPFPGDDAPKPRRRIVGA